MTKNSVFLKREVRKRLYLDLTTILIVTIVFSAVIFLVPVYKSLNDNVIQFLLLIMVTVSYVMNAITLSYVRRN